MKTARETHTTYGAALVIDEEGRLMPTPFRVENERCWAPCDEAEFVDSGHVAVPGYLSTRLLAGLPGIGAGSTSVSLVSGYLMHRVSAELASGQFTETESALLAALHPSDGASVATYPEGETPPTRGAGERESKAEKGGRARSATGLGIDGPVPTHPPSPQACGGLQ